MCRSLRLRITHRYLAKCRAQRGDRNAVSVQARSRGVARARIRMTNPRFSWRGEAAHCFKGPASERIDVRELPRQRRIDRNMQPYAQRICHFSDTDRIEAEG